MTTTQDQKLIPLIRKLIDQVESKTLAEGQLTTLERDELTQEFLDRVNQLRDDESL